MKKTHFEFGHSVKFSLYHPLESKDCIAQKMSFDFQHRVHKINVQNPIKVGLAINPMWFLMLQLKG